MTRIAFIGAGSVVFTKNLLGDILDFPALREVEIALHDIDRRPARDRRGDGALRRGRPGREPDDHRAPRSARRDRRLRLRAEHGADRRARGDAARLRDPGALRRCARRSPTRSGSAASSARCAPPTHMLALGHELAELCPRRSLAPELHEPDGRALRARLQGHADQERRRALPLRAVHDRGSVRSSSACPRARSRSSPPASTTRRSSSASSTTARASTRVSTSASPADPELQRRVRVALYRRLGFFPTESSEHAAEYVPWFMRHDDEIEHYRIPVDEYISRSEANLVEYRAREGARSRAARRSRSRARTSTRP